MEIKDYRGFELRSVREKGLLGGSVLIRTAFRNTDGWCLEDWSCHTDETGETVRSNMTNLKEMVDDYWSNPADYEINR